MNKMILLFDEYVMKAITMTETMINSDYRDSNKLENFTANRERLLSLIDQISLQIDWTTVEAQARHELSRKIDYIKQLDVTLVAVLQEYQEEVRQEVEQTFKQKENIKGYNLTDVK